ncbi:nacht nucleoside triphosphatase [Metarhizium guizhouense ARSEF 977]|uniref:Nacht nucleoside triphosphatase n=1 Tax=Metarhizium guizhouense (strain ARSEF 977) TaxID=1276136 RepID=A0A0B4HYH6_METGA|nr:nacht nucleoside triphosphatase [Metarhizium guizhouense ARSEF 977]
MASSHENKTVLFRANPATRDADADLDIIAIHGLDTQSPGTWTYSKSPDADVNWLLDENMLAARVKGARIFTCNWPAELLQKPDTIATTLEESARHLLNSLTLHMAEGRRETPRRPRRPILFIASCLGGIILIKALARDPKLDNDERDLTALRKATRGIVFLATPFRGTSFKEIPGFILPLWAWLGSRSVSALIDCTREPPSHLDELVHHFVELQRKHDIHAECFWEGKKTNLLRKLVHKDSATLTGGRGQRLDRPHVLMNKFGGPECQDYSTVAKTIEEMAVKIREGGLLARADRMIKERYFDSGKLKIKRLSGDPLAMKSCYINLAVVEKAGDGKSREADDSVSFSVLDRQRVKTPKKTCQVNLSKIFDAQQNKGGKQPRRILIQGRAGVGKTTLCKKMVHDFYTPETELHCSWTRLFDRLLWVPLRNLKLGNTRDTPGYNLEKLLLHEFFSRPTSEPEFARELSESMTAVANRTLFLLDGLDEILHDLSSSGDMYAFVQELLNQPNVIITSRPSAAGLSRGVGSPDLELETVGFYPDQVDEYVRMAFTDTHKFEQVRNFLQQHWRIQGLVRIPIQLDALCYTWNDRLETVPDTMTSMYELIELKLWKKDIVHRLGLKREDNEPLSEDDLQSVGREYVEKRVPEEMSLLEGLAFSGLINNMIDFQEKHVKMIAGQSSAGFLYSKTCRDISFLRSSDFSLATSDQRYYFIHLTFQEYFAARYFVKQWKSKRNLVTIRFKNEPRSNIVDVSVEDFVRDEKYNASYDIFWRFVAGLLGGNDDQICDFFCMVQNEPRDLLGPVHQRLVIHCLSEISLPKVPKFQKLYQQLECEAKQWLVLELRMRDLSRLAAEMEFPDKILAEAFEGFPEIETQLYRSFHFRPIVPLTVMDHIASCLGDAKKDRIGALRVIQYARGSTSEKVIRAVVKLLKDDDTEVSHFAAKILSEQSVLPQDVVQAIVKLATGPDKDLRSDALWALQKQTTLPQDVLQSLVDLLKDDYEVVQILGAQSALPQDVVKALASLLKDPVNNVRRRAVCALGTKTALPQYVVQALVNLLHDSDNDVCLSAVSALCEHSCLSQDVLKALMNMLQSPDNRVLLSSAEVEDTKKSRKDLLKEVAKVLLSPAAPSDDVFFEQVVHLLKNGPKITQRCIAGCLWHPLVPTSKVTRLMAHAKDHPNAVVRTKAAWAMEGRRPFEKALPEELTLALEYLLNDSVKSVRIAALLALKAQPGPWHLGLQEELTKVAVDLLTDSEEDVRKDAIDYGGQLVGLSEEVVQAVANLLEDPNTDIRREAIQSLRFHKTARTLPTTVVQRMACLLEDPDQLTRKYAVDSLTSHEALPKEVLQALASTLHNPTPERRAQAASILGGQVELPLDVLQAMANLLKFPEGTLSHYTAMKAFNHLAALPDQSFCSKLAEMDDQCFTRLYREWLRRAFWDHSFIYEKNNVYHIHLPRGHQEIPVPQFQRAVQAAQKALNIPDIKPLSIKDSYQQLTCQVEQDEVAHIADANIREPPSAPESEKQP